MRQLWLGRRTPCTAETCRPAHRSGVDSGEFRGDVNVAAAADIATAMLDGAGVRMLIRDPAMQLERTRALVAETLARELGVGPGVLASSRDQ
jgi:hypothetical protein